MDPSTAIIDPATDQPLPPDAIVRVLCKVPSDTQPLFNQFTQS